MHTCWLHTRHGESLSSDIERKMSGIEKRNASFAVFCQRNYNPTFYNNTGDCNHLPDPEVGRQLPDFFENIQAELDGRPRARAPNGVSGTVVTSDAKQSGSYQA